MSKHKSSIKIPFSFTILLSIKFHHETSSEFDLSGNQSRDETNAQNEEKEFSMLKMKTKKKRRFRVFFPKKKSVNKRSLNLHSCAARSSCKFKVILRGLICDFTALRNLTLECKVENNRPELFIYVHRFLCLDCFEHRFYDLIPDFPLVQSYAPGRNNKGPKRTVKCNSKHETA